MKYTIESNTLEKIAEAIRDCSIKDDNTKDYTPLEMPEAIRQLAYVSRYKINTINNKLENISGRIIESGTVDITNASTDYDYYIDSFITDSPNCIILNRDLFDTTTSTPTLKIGDKLTIYTDDNYSNLWVTGSPDLSGQSVTAKVETTNYTDYYIAVGYVTSLGPYAGQYGENFSYTKVQLASSQNRNISVGIYDGETTAVYKTKDFSSTSVEFDSTLYTSENDSARKFCVVVRHYNNESVGITDFQVDASFTNNINIVGSSSRMPFATVIKQWSRSNLITNSDFYHGDLTSLTLDSTKIKFPNNIDTAYLITSPNTNFNLKTIRLN